MVAQVIDGFYHIEYTEDRYDMRGFQLAAHLSLPSDRTSHKGANVMVHSPGTSGSVWAIKRVSEGVYNILFGDDRDGMQGFYLTTGERKNFDKHGYCAAIVTSSVPGSGAEWVFTQVEGAPEGHVTIAAANDKAGLEGFCLSAHRYNPSDRRADDGAYVSAQQPIWCGNVWKLSPASAPIVPTSILVHSLEFNFDDKVINSIGPNILADISFDNTSQTEQTFVFTSTKSVTNVHTIKFESGFAKSVTDPTFLSNTVSGVARINLPRIQGEVNTSNPKSIDIKVNAETTTFNIEETLSLEEPGQPPFSLPVKCGPQSRTHGRMQVLVVDLSVPWSALESITWPMFGIVTTAPIHGSYRASLNSQLSVSFHDSSSGSSI